MDVTETMREPSMDSEPLVSESLSPLESSIDGAGRRDEEGGERVLPPTEPDREILCLVGSSGVPEILISTGPLVEGPPPLMEEVDLVGATRSTV